MNVDDPEDPVLKPASRTNIEVLVDHIHDRVGSDLATHTDLNMLHHTGQGRDLRDASSVKECRPWEWVWRVAEARSLGEECAKPEKWDDSVRRHVQEHMFGQ